LLKFPKFEEFFEKKEEFMQLIKPYFEQDKWEVIALVAKKR